MFKHTGMLQAGGGAYAPPDFGKIEGAALLLDPTIPLFNVNLHIGAFGKISSGNNLLTICNMI
jgi:hypothetical protein